jgi:WD40 repeat protein
MSDNDPSVANPFGQIADEFVEALRQGKRPSVEEFAQRYPEHADEIRDMLPALVLMEQAKTADDAPGQQHPSPSSAAAPPLRQLGDYQILREVGRGGMGVVYEAQQLSLGRHVAIKVLPAHALLDPRHLARFHREARSAAKLQHTNIVPVFGVGEQDELHYYVMQFIPGLALDVVLDELRRLRRPRGQQAPTGGDAPGRPLTVTRDVSAVAVARSLLSGEFRPPVETGDVTTPPAQPAAAAPVAAAAPAGAADTSATIHLPGRAGAHAELLANWLPKGELPDRRGWEWFYLNSLPYYNLRTFTESGSSKGPCTVAWHVGSKRLAEGTADGLIRIRNLDREQTTLLLIGPAPVACYYGVRWLGWSPDGGKLTAGGNGGKVRIWDTATRKEVLSLEGHDASRINQGDGLIRRLACSPDGKHLAAAGLDGRALVWEVAKGREVLALPADGGAVWSVAWSPDGTRLAAGSQDGTIRVVEGLEHTPKVHVFKALPSEVRALAWSPKGGRLASGGPDALLKLWDPIRGAELARLQGHSYCVFGVAWSSDGKRLASASGDSLVIAWDADTGRKLRTMRGHSDFVMAVAWSPDGKRLASAGIDNSVPIWDPDTGAEAFVLRGNFGRFDDVSWHRDGAQLAAASSDGHAWVWDATRGFGRDATARAVPFIDRHEAEG